MRNLKKVLALVLAMAMSLSLAVTAGAAFNDQDKIVNEDAVDMCVALNIINGYTDGSFKPEGNVTRAEAAKMICIALNGGKEPVLSASATPAFADIAGHWAAKYIEYCVSEGIVAGKSATQFDPNGNVTGTELAKMLLIAIGYNAEHAKFLGANWDTNVNVVASQKDLYEDLETIDPAVALSRDNAAQMIWNALQAVLVEYDYTLVSTNGTLSSQVVVDDKDGDPTLLETKYNALIEVAVMTDAAYNETDEDYDYTMSERAFGVTIPEASSLDVTALDADEDYSDLVGRTVTVVYKNNAAKDVYGIFAEDAVVVSAPAHTYGTPANGEVKIDGTEYDIDDTVAFYAYGVTGASVNVATRYPAAMVNFIDSDDDGEINYATFVPYAVYDVTYVGAKSFTINSVNYKFDGTGTKYIAYDGIAEDDVVLAVAADYNVDQKITFTKLDVLTGKVASTNGTKVQIDGTWYQTDGNVNLGSEYDFSVVNGYIVDYTAASTTVDAEDYVVVADKAVAAGWAGNQVKLVYTNGTTEIKDYDTGVTGQIEFAAVMKADEAQGATMYVVDDKDADDKVELYAIETVKAEGADNVGGFDGYTANAYSKAADKAGKIDSKAIADDAIVFVYNSTEDEVSVITGAELAKLSAATNVNAYYNTSDTTGYDSIVLAFVKSAMVSVSDIQYGYVTADVTTSWDEDDQAVDTVTFWSAAGEKTLTTDAANDGKLAIGKYFEYKLDENGDMTDVVVYGAGQMWAVSAYNGTDITLADADKNVLDTFEIDEDTVVVYVDSENQEGVEGGSIELCNTDANGKYVLNVLAVAQGYSADKTMDILFVDIANEIQ